MTTEITVGPGNLMGYELYDLVMLNDNECAVIIVVGAEKLRIINQSGDVSEVYPMDLQSKRNAQSQRSTAFDKSQNTIAVGDTVNVVSGIFAKKSGTVKHIMKGTIWLHSNSYLKDSGVFVVRGKQCVIAGGKTSTSNLAASYSRVMATPTLGGPAGAGGSSNTAQKPMSQPLQRGGKDPNVGKTVRITKGGFKGLLAQIVDATPTHFSVELLAKMKKLVIERDKTTIVGDKEGSIFVDNRATSTAVNHTDALNTPFLTSQTPIYSLGSETPRYGTGSETPIYGLGSETPYGGQNDNDVWKVGAMDQTLQQGATPMFGYSNNSSSNHHNNANPSVADSSRYSNASTGRFDGSSPALSSVFPPSTDNSVYTGGGSSYTPMSYGNDRESTTSRSHATSATAIADNTTTFRDWIENTVVVGNRGDYFGKLAIIQQRADEVVF